MLKKILSCSTELKYTVGVRMMELFQLYRTMGAFIEARFILLMN